MGCVLRKGHSRALKAMVRTAESHVGVSADVFASSPSLQ